MRLADHRFGKKIFLINDHSLRFQNDHFLRYVVIEDFLVMTFTFHGSWQFENPVILQLGGNYFDTDYAQNSFAPR